MGGTPKANDAESKHTPEEEDELSPIEEVRLTVANTDDPSLPVWTFRMWFLGITSCILLSFLNTFFSFRTEPLSITQITVVVATLPIGHFMARVLPKKKFKLGSQYYSLNPGPFNMKEHVLISIFANAGSGVAYAVNIVAIIKAFYGREITILASWLLIITTQVLGYGWAGIIRKYVVEPGHMWWPGTLVQVSIFRTMHEKDAETDRVSRGKFFTIALICSFLFYIIPGYLFPTLTSISWICWVFTKSVTAQQLGSGMRGLGVGSFTLDWSAVSSFLGSPLITPFFSIANVIVGYIFIIYMVVPMSYWGINLHNAKTFPIFSSKLFRETGQPYNVSAIVNEQFEINMVEYEKQGRIHMSMFFSLAYGFGFATIAATVTHVALFYGKEIFEKYTQSSKEKVDIHTRLMKKYQDIPSWWFHLLLMVSFGISLYLCTALRDQVQMPWWGLLASCFMAFAFTLPISILGATTNVTPGLNIITEYVMGLVYPGRPIANVVFKTYGYISMAQAITFLSDFKLGHYMKIPPRSMFLVQFFGTILAGTVNLGAAWMLLTNVENICNDELLPDNSPWSCPLDRVFYDASVIWGLVGPKRIFGSLGDYAGLNWFFVGGALCPVVVWILHKIFPKKSWITLINFPVLFGGISMMPPATTVNYNSWILVGTIFNFFVFRYRKIWWKRYNYVLSAALDAGVAFMGVFIYFALTMEETKLEWWGTMGEHCPLAPCPTAKGVIAKGCPVFS